MDMALNLRFTFILLIIPIVIIPLTFHYEVSGRKKEIEKLQLKCCCKHNVHQANWAVDWHLIWYKDCCSKKTKETFLYRTGGAGKNKNASVTIPISVLGVVLLGLAQWSHDLVTNFFESVEKHFFQRPHFVEGFADLSSSGKNQGSLRQPNDISDILVWVELGEG